MSVPTKRLNERYEQHFSLLIVFAVGFGDVSPYICTDCFCLI